MGYCVLSDVQALNPKRTYNTTSSPTSTQVEGYIESISNEIDSLLSSRGLTVPITAPADFLGHLKQVNAYGAAALAEQAMFPGTAGPDKTSHGRWLWSVYRQALTQLENSELPTSIEGGSGPQSFFEQHPVTEPTENYEWRKPKFGKDKVF